MKRLLRCKIGENWTFAPKIWADLGDERLIRVRLMRVLYCIYVVITVIPLRGFKLFYLFLNLFVFKAV